MNPNQSFYYGHDDWQYPSPSSTPRSTKHTSSQYGDLTDFDTSQAFLNTGWSEGQLPFHLDGAAGGPQPTIHTSKKTTRTKDQDKKDPRNKQKTTSKHPPALMPKQPHQQILHATQQPSALTNSFLDQLDGASLQEPFSGWLTMESINVTTSHMQTPPPTRDTSTRRKAHQPAIKNSTPSTIKSQRQSAPAKGWLQQNLDQAPLEPSPVQMTPLQFSPPASHSFSNEGAATAPAYPQSNIFWGSDTHNDPDLMSFSSHVDDPFSTPSQGGLSLGIPQWPSVKAKARAGTSSGISNPTTRNPSFSHGLARSQTAKPTTTFRSDGPYDDFTTSGVDPSMLWSSQISDSRQLMIPDLPAGTSVEGVLPYQYQVEELRRQKEQQRMMKSSRHSRSSVGASSASGDAAPSLRRSLTDSRSRKSMVQSSFSDPLEQDGGSRSSHIPRHSSPLKRQRLDPNSGSSDYCSGSPRKSVVLAIDESGRARTVVQSVPGLSRTTSRSTHMSAADDESDSDTARDYDNHSRDSLPGDKPTADTPQRHDAQEALRAMRRERQQCDLPGSQSAPRLTTKTPADSFALDAISPNTISDEEMQYGINTARPSHPYYETLCICNHNIANAYMLQCESCKKWSHLGCLGLDPASAPEVYLCTFCANTPPGGRGDSLRSKKPHSAVLGRAPYYR